MGSATIVRPVLASQPLTFRDPAGHQLPQLTYACVAEYRAWIHIIRLGVRQRDPMLLHDARNVLGRALMDMGADIPEAETEARIAVRRRNAVLIVNSVSYRGMGADGKRFRVVAVDVGQTRVVAVVPATQEEISVKLADG